MIKIILSLFIFCFTLFFYLHIHFHLKSSNDLEILEMDNENFTKDTFEEICDLRQPILFEFENNKLFQQINKKLLFDNFSSFDLKIRETIDNSTIFDPELEIYLPLQIHLAFKLFNQNNKKYYSENNLDFLQESGILKIMQKNDYFLRPALVSNCYYDILLGSNESFTPFRFNLNYRNFFIVTQGRVKVKLAPPKNIRYLNVEYDYENFEFRSTMNPWIISDDKIKCLELTLYPGKCFFIPAYWFYSFQFESDSCMCCFLYRTFMNNIAIIPEIAMHTLQTTNVERKIVKKLNLDNLFDNKNGNDINVNDINVNDININDKNINETDRNNSNGNNTNINDTDGNNINVNINNNEKLMDEKDSSNFIINI